MSISTLVGFILGIGLFVAAIFMSTDKYAAFIDIPSFVMVVGGTFAGTFIAYEPRYVILSLKMIPKIFFAPTIGRNLLRAEVGRIIRWGYAVQKNGLPALDAEVKKLEGSDKFLKFGVDMVIAGYSGDEVRTILNTTIESTFGRNSVPAKILQDMGANAPAFGMIGTLVGLVIMLGNLSDPAALGPSLSIALITTLYGVMFARLLFIPAGSKVQQREDIVRFRNYLVAEGLVLLAEQKSPRYIQDRMNSFLDPAIHFDIDTQMKDKA